MACQIFASWNQMAAWLRVVDALSTLPEWLDGCGIRLDGGSASQRQTDGRSDPGPSVQFAVQCGSRASSTARRSTIPTRPPLYAHRRAFCSGHYFRVKDVMFQNNRND